MLAALADYNPLETRAGEQFPVTVIFILGMGLLGLGTAVGTYGTYVTLLIEQGVSPGLAGFGMTLLLLGQFLAVMPADRLMRIHSVQSITAGGFVLIGVGAALMAFTTVSAVYSSRALLGIGQAAAFMGAMQYVGRRAPDALISTVQGLIGALYSVGLAFGIAAGPWVIGTFGTELPALATACVALVAAIATPSIASLPETPRISFASYLRPLTSKTGLALGLGNMATFGFLMVATTWYTDVLASVPAIPATGMLTVFAMTTIIGRTAGGLLSRRYEERVLVDRFLIVTAGTLLIFPVALHATSSVLLTFAILGSGFGFSLPFGPLFSLAFSELSNDPGVTLVVMIIIGNLGALLYPWIIGELAGFFQSYTIGFVVLGGSAVGIWLVWRNVIMPQTI